MTLPEAHARAMRDLPEMLTFARAMAAALPEEEAARWATRADALEAALQILRIGVPCPMPGARLGAWLDPFGGGR